MSTYYALRRRPVSAADLADAYAANALRGIWMANFGVYGIRKLWHEATRQGHGWGREQVGRLMAIAGIRGVVRGEHRIRTTEAEPEHPRQPDLVKRAWDAPTGQNQLWVADFT